MISAIQAALTQLDLPCYHGFTLFIYSLDAKYWLQLLNRKYLSPGKGSSTDAKSSTSQPSITTEEFDHVLGSYSACCDMPCTLVAEDLIAAYPNAKVILVERELEAWYASFEQVVIEPYVSCCFVIILVLGLWLNAAAWILMTIEAENNGTEREALTKLTRSSTYSPLAPIVARLDDHMHSMYYISKPWAEGQFKAKNMQEFKANARSVYIEHYRRIRELVPPERLLNFDIKDGWEPLCDFLGKDVPVDRPFPRANEGFLANEKVLLIVKKAVWRVLGRVCQVALLILFFLAIL